MNENTILIIEDEPSIAEVMLLYLRRAGFSVEIVEDGETALKMLGKQLPRLVILDLMLPGVDGWTITRWLRERSEIPIIHVTARKEEMERIAGLEMGADDYVVKPFSPQELVSRVRAVLRRSSSPPGRTDGKPLVFTLHKPTSVEASIDQMEMSINPQTRLVTINGQEVTLTATEFELLWLLASNPRQVFTRQRLLEEIWGVTEYLDPGTITVHIRRLREKLEEDPSKPQRLVTVWGVGYKFEP